MDFLVTLFWIGLILTFGMYVFQVVAGIIIYAITAFIAGIYWVFCKLTGKDF